MRVAEGRSGPPPGSGVLRETIRWLFGWQCRELRSVRLLPTRSDGALSAIPMARMLDLLRPHPWDAQRTVESFRVACPTRRHLFQTRPTERGDGRRQPSRRTATAARTWFEFRWSFFPRPLELEATNWTALSDPIVLGEVDFAKFQEAQWEARTAITKHGTVDAIVYWYELSIGGARVTNKPASPLQ